MSKDDMDIKFEEKAVVEIVNSIFKSFDKYQIPNLLGCAALGLAFTTAMKKYGASKENIMKSISLALDLDEEDKNA